MSTAPSGPPLETLGKYRIVRMLGIGAAGTVYLAEDMLLRRNVALKVLSVANPSDRASIDRFVLEARSASRLDHPNTVHVYEIDERDGRHYIAMEWLPGGSAQLAVDERGSIPWPEATRWVLDAARGLEAAHQAGMLHRDIKPANLLRSEDGSIKIGDFGLVKLLGPATPMLTALGSPIGTPSFMSPEQCQGEQLDVRSDVYSLGATYYALLTGKPPYESETSFGVMFAHCANPLPDPRETAPEIPVACVDIIRRAMAKAPSDRFATAGEMLRALEAIDGTSPGTTMTSATDRTVVLPHGVLPGKRRVARWPWAVGLTSVVVLAVVAVLGLRRLERAPVESVAAALPTPSAPEGEAKPPAGRPGVPEIADREFRSIVALGRHKGAVTDLDFSSSGQGVATSSVSGSATIWSLPTAPKYKYRDYVNPEPGHPIHALAYCGPRRRLVTPVGLGKLALWDSTKGATIDVVEHPHGVVRAIEFSPDGRLLATGGDIGLHLWEVTDEDKIVDQGPIANDMAMVSSIAFSPVTSWLGAIAWNGDVVLWDWKTRRFYQRWQYPPAQSTSLAFGKDRLEWTWTLRDGRVFPSSLVARLKQFPARLHFDCAPACCDYAYGRRLLAISGGGDGEVYFLNLEDQTISRMKTGIRVAVSALKFSPLDNRVAMGTARGDVLVAELPEDVFPPAVPKEEAALDRLALAVPDRYQIKASLGPVLDVLQKQAHP